MMVQKGKLSSSVRRGAVVAPHSYKSRSLNASTVAENIVNIATVKHSLKILDQLFLPLNANEKLRYDMIAIGELHSLLIGYEVYS